VALERHIKHTLISMTTATPVGASARTVAASTPAMRVGQHNTFLPIRGSVHYDLLWLPELCAGAENEHRGSAA